MANNQTAVEWLIEKMGQYNFEMECVREKYNPMAIEMEKEQKKEELIGLLQWMNKVAETNPMAFETDSNDIVEMYMNGYYK